MRHLHPDQLADRERPARSAGTDFYRLRRGRIMTIAMAVCFAISIPLYLVIGQLAFVLWAVVPIGTSLIMRRLYPGTAARA
jgi:hypothetical protein